jgi:plasmid maintenance system antidote protein VapI
MENLLSPFPNAFYGMTKNNSNMLAKALDVPANRITAIIKGQRGITGDTRVID